MAFTLRYKSKALAEKAHAEAERDGYKPTKIRLIKGMYVFSLTR